MIKPCDTVYICGPMSGLPQFNYPAFREAETLIRKRYGCRVLNPARQPDGLEYDEYMRRGCADVVSATVVIVLPGWQKSPGAKDEMACAAIHGIRVVMWEELGEGETIERVGVYSITI